MTTFKKIVFTYYKIAYFSMRFFFITHKLGQSEKKKKAETITLKQEFINYLKFLPFAIIILIMCQFIRTYSSLSLKSEYRIIENNKVIVYSNNDYFLTLDCEIDGEILIIYKGTQMKIGNTNVYSRLDSFQGVEIK